MTDYQKAAYEHSHKIRDEAQKHLDKKILDGGHILATQKRCVDRLPRI